MMRGFLLLVMLLSTTILKAEYNGYHYQFEIETVSGKKLIGYSYVADGYMEDDSIQSSNYLKMAIGFKSVSLADSFFYHTDRYTYMYRNPNDSANTEYPVYCLINPTGLPMSKIRSIRVIDRIRFSYLIGVFNEVTSKDLVWMRKPVLERYYFSAYLCDFALQLHKKSTKAKSIIQSIEKLTRPLKDEEFPEETLEEIQKKVEELLKQLHNEEVMIVTFCTC